MEAITLVNDDMTHIETFTKQMIDDFFNLCHYWPMQVKRDSNQSTNMYKVLSSAKAQDHQTSLQMYKTQS